MVETRIIKIRHASPVKIQKRLVIVIEARGSVSWNCPSLGETRYKSM